MHSPIPTKPYLLDSQISSYVLCPGSLIMLIATESNLRKRLIILTDSRSTVSAFNKFAVEGNINWNIKISSFLSAVYGLSFNFIYVRSDSPEIKAVDFISRFKSSNKIKDCTKSIVCETGKNIEGFNRVKLLTNLQNELSKLNFEQPLRHSKIDYIEYNYLMNRDFESPEAKNL